MARTDADFAAYVAARWPALVRTVVLLGCPRDRAEDVVLDGLARCWGDWEQVLRTEEPEVRVHRELLRAWRRHRRTAAGGSDPTGEGTALEAQLAALTAEQRELVVVRALSGLAPDQVARVLDVDADSARKIVPGAPSEEALREAAGSLAVLPVRFEQVADRARHRRRRRRRVVVASAVVGVLVLGAGTWAGAALSDEGVRERSVDVDHEHSPVSITWYAEGRLHLPEVTVTVPGVTDLAAVGESVVYLDEAGIVGQVEPDGTVFEIGVAFPGSQLLGAAEPAWAAWVQPGDPESRLVVWDTAARSEVGGLRVDESVRPIAIDDGLLLFHIASGDHAWVPPDAEPDRLAPVGLVDQASGTRVFQRDQRIEIVQPRFGLTFLRPGEGGRLSLGGRYALSEVPGDDPGGDPGAGWEPLLYDTRSGDAIDTGVEAGERVVAAGFTPTQEVAYLLPAGDDLLLRTCEPRDAGPALCSDDLPIQAGGAPVLLAD